MTIAFPDGMAQRIEALARQHGYSSAAEYLMKLVEDAEAESDFETAAPPEVSPKDRAELEAMLEAGMNSGSPVRATPEFWEERRKVLEERMAKRKGDAP
jgi:Arc/MetJ-type ribon-helix-helix transcriptional regulator